MDSHSKHNSSQALPKVVLLENVPRLLNSPANARGLNFAIILDDLLDLGYHVEWRVINAADYGMPQQRNRVFIWHTGPMELAKTTERMENWIRL